MIVNFNNNIMVMSNFLTLGRRAARSVRDEVS